MDIDFNKMSTDELKTFIESGGETLPNVEETPKTQDEIESTKPDPEIELNATEEAAIAKPEVEELPFYRGKTREQVIEMQENAKRKISQQENEAHKLRLELEKLKGMVEVISKNQPSENVVSKDDELLSQYDSNDLKAIALLTERQLQQRELDRKRKEEEVLREARSSNETQWEILSSIIDEMYPENSQKIQDAILDDIKKNPDLTYNKKNWLKENWKNYLTKSEKKEAQANLSSQSSGNIIKRKLSASSVGSGNGTSGSSQPKKSISQMTSQEYLDYITSQGVDIRKGVVLS